MDEVLFMDETYPIMIDGEHAGTLTVARRGLLTEFTARCADPGRLLRLSVYGGGREGYLGVMAPEGGEYIGDVMNVLFSNGWICDEDGKVFIYYASSDTRMHVATSTVDRLVDYCLHTAPDGLRTGLSVETLNRLIDKNLSR